MENKLQELTKKLYDEGLSKGRKEAEALLADANAKAKKIVAEAEAEAGRIRKKAQSDAEDLRKNTLTELSLAGKQVIGTIKADVQDMIVAKAIDEPVKNAALDPKFVEEMLVAVAKNWSGSSAEKVSLKAMLPKEMEGKLDSELEKSVLASLGNELEITFSDGVKSGFKVGPKKGGYYISFTDDSFNALLGEYLRPKVSEMLYGKED